MKGLHDSILGCKLNDTFIRDNTFSHDLTVLSETWGCSHNPSIQGYNSIVLKPNKPKGKSVALLAVSLYFTKRIYKQKLRF